jgi:hypothetical protein
MNLATRVVVLVALASFGAGMPVLADKAAPADKAVPAAKGESTKPAAKTESAKQPAGTSASQQAATETKSKETPAPAAPKGKAAKKGLTLGKAK